MTTALGGLDALVFTGGVGERSAPVRAGTVGGPRLPRRSRSTPDRNAAADGDDDLSPAGARARVLLVHAREDLEIARQVRVALGAAA